MQVTVEDVKDLTKKLHVVLAADFVEQRLQAAYDELRAGVSLKGFRKGKVPRKIIEKTYRPRVEAEVAEKMIQETYFDALQESKLDAVVHPEVRTHEYAADGSFSYDAEIDVRPEFELIDYKAMTIELPEKVVDEAAVDQALEELRHQMAPLKAVSGRGVQDGDVVVMDFQGYHEGRVMKQVVGENYTVDVGSGKNGKEFEENLLGLEVGQETSRTIDFPAGFANPVLAGKTVLFKITVKDIKERVLPELDDEFAKDVDAKFTDLAALKDHLRQEEEKKIADLQQAELTDKIMAKLIDEHQFPLPERLVIYEAEMLVKEMEQNLLRQGLSLEKTGMSKDQLAANYREAAEKRVKGDFIIKKIADKENIKVADNDIEEGFVRVAQQYNMTVNEVKQYFRNRDDLLPMINELLNEKVLKMMRQAVTVTTVPQPAEEA